jgi:hypothetical protein
MIEITLWAMFIFAMFAALLLSFFGMKKHGKPVEDEGRTTDGVFKKTQKSINKKGGES